MQSANDKYKPTDFGFPEGTDLAALWCRQWYRVNIGFKKDVRNRVEGELIQLLGAIQVIRPPMAYDAPWIYFYAHRMSRTGRGVKIWHAEWSLRYYYPDSLDGGCRSIPVESFKKDLEAGIIEQLTDDQVAALKASGELKRMAEADRREIEARYDEATSPAFEDTDTYIDAKGRR